MVRFCPACGAEGVIVRADGSVGCRRCRLVLYFNVASAVAALIEDDIGRVLLVERAREPGKGALDLPGGFVDAGETAEDALVREVWEELNLTVQKCSMRYLASFPNTYVFEGVAYRTLDMAFTCAVETFAGRRASDEIGRVAFYSPSQVPLERVGFESIRNIIETYSKGMWRRDPWPQPS
jgi:NADH pyrophosphatase NudC (nudix superfamily)